MQLSDIVPWGRLYREYVAMFALSGIDVGKRILGCGDGPASFNAELSAAGGSVISVDPIYDVDGATIERRFEEVAPSIIGQVLDDPLSWVWNYHRAPAELLENRRQALQRFLGDYERGKRMGRYCAGALPCLPFANKTFELALCSHLLFLYSGHLSEQFHIDSVLELCRVADEVRIFPLLTLAHERSPHLSSVCKALSTHGWRSQIVRVSYEFQRGANEMLLIQRA